MTNETSAAFEVVPFPRIRNLIIDSMRAGHRKHMIHGLIEADVTLARQYIREQEAATGEQLSFTAFIANCVGKAVDMNKYMHALRSWRRQLVLFDQVDVNTVVEVEFEGRKFPMLHILRSVNQRTYGEINGEIQMVQKAGGSRMHGSSLRRLAYLPRFIRAPSWWLRERCPRIAKENAGTVALTAIGMFGEGSGWGIPIVSHTLNITLGGIAEKPGVVDGSIAVREYLSMTLTFDHDIIDGAPAARFTERLKDLIEEGYGLMGPDSSTVEP
jgi:pyruvate/2-oxoglutarate dehydrogenase complex dihydrolipoamide acyltransferase (E2) component